MIFQRTTHSLLFERTRAMAKALKDIHDAAERDRAVKHADDLWAWAKQNVHLPTEFIKEYEAGRTNRKANAKAKHTNGE
jgi:hypothetical protein